MRKRIGWVPWCKSKDVWAHGIWPKCFGTKRDEVLADVDGRKDDNGERMIFRILPVFVELPRDTAKQ